MKISYHRRRKIKTRRIAIRDLILRGIENPIDLAKELKQNYVDSFMEISHFIEDDNQIVVKYNHKVTTIENPKEFVLIAKIVAIWEFEDDKIKKGYQISKPN